MNESTDLPIPAPTLLVIDGDGIPYILGWINREHTEVELMYTAIDSWMSGFILATGATRFIGILAFPKSRCFRYDVYLYNSYKGNRQGEKEPWIAYWEPVVREYLVEKWGFVHAPAHLESDDVVAALALDNSEAIIASPDKDLRQIAGKFYNFKEFGTEKHKGMETVTKQQAIRNFYLQLLTGDSTDNISGVVGQGPVKAAKLLDETSPLQWGNAVKLSYQKQYGQYYGDIIHAQTLSVIQMMTPLHPLWDIMGFDMEQVLRNIRNSEEYVRPICIEVEREAFM